MVCHHISIISLWGGRETLPYLVTVGVKRLVSGFDRLYSDRFSEMDLTNRHEIRISIGLSWFIPKTVLNKWVRFKL